MSQVHCKSYYLAFHMEKSILPILKLFNLGNDTFSPNHKDLLAKWTESSFLIKVWGVMKFLKNYIWKALCQVLDNLKFGAAGSSQLFTFYFFLEFSDTSHWNIHRDAHFLNTVFPKGLTNRILYSLKCAIHKFIDFCRI